MSILSSITSMVTPLIIDRVAAAIGINSGLARTAINLALPAVLNAFASKAATPAGATALHNAVSSANPNIFGSIESLLSGGNKDQFVKSGTATLNNLLGSNAVGQLASTIGSNSGISGNVSSMLLPMVGQFALSGLAKSSAGIDAHGLAQMLAGDHSASVAQGTRRVVEEHVTRAAVAGTTTTREIPREVPKPVVHEVHKEIPREMPKMAEVKKPVEVPVHKPAPMPAATGGGFMRWILPLLAALAALWYFTAGRNTDTAMVDKPVEKTMEKKVEETAPAATTTAGVVIDGVDVNKSIGDVFTGLTTTLGTVTDAASATAALPKLTEYSGMVDKVAGVATKFSPEQKTMVGGLISAGLPAVRAAADKALAGAGVGDLLKPVVDGMFAKIEGLAK